MKTYFAALLVGLVAHWLLVLPFLLFHGLPWSDALPLSSIGAPLAILVSRAHPLALPRDHPRFREFVATFSVFPAVLFVIIQSVAWVAIHERGPEASHAFPIPLSISIVVSVIAFVLWVTLSWYLKQTAKAAEPGATDNPDDAQRN